MEPPRSLHSAGEVRNLSLTEAARGYPVQFRATVLLNDHIEDGSALNVVFVHDGSLGIFVGSHGPPLDLQPGNTVELRGRSAVGGFAPYVTDPVFVPLGAASLPPARPISLGEALGGREDSQWAEISGVVRAVYLRNERLHLQLAAGRERLEVEFAGRCRAMSANAPPVDAVVKVRGVVCPVFNGRRQLLGASLYSPELRYLQVVDLPPPDPFQGPNRGYDDLLQYIPGQTSDRRVKVRGTVSFCLPGKAVFLSGGGQGLLVKSSQLTPLNVGDPVEALGFPAAGIYKAMLEDGSFRLLGASREAPTIHSIDAATALRGDYDCTLVRMRGRLVQQFQTGAEHVLLLEDGAHLFSAHLPLPGARAEARELRADSLLDVTGVCVAAGTLHTDVNDWRPEAFQLLVAAPDDVVVRTAPPWWTRRRLLLAVAAVSLVLLIAVLWAIALRRQVVSQTAVIQEQSRREATLEERNRIARELHDTLAQSFAGSAFALESAATRLKGEKHPLFPQVDLALRTVRGGLTEVRRSLMNLRAAPLERRDLPAALREAAQGLAEGSAARLCLRLPAAWEPLPAEAEAELYRIAVEAMTNAVRHGAPRRLTVELSRSDRAAALRVADDGAGFDPAARPLDHHYGLLGMRERAGRIGGSLKIVSAPGQGADVRLTVPHSRVTALDQRGGASASVPAAASIPPSRP